MPPLIYIHKGYSWYVPLALRNGKRFADEVHYLGGSYGRKIAGLCGARTARLSEFHRQADQFRGIYRHHSELGPEFELFCIQRWFILAEYMEHRGLERCVYLDTDVLLARRIDPEIDATRPFGITYTGYSAHVCIVNRLDALQRFCSWVVDLYSDPANEARLKDWHSHMIGDSGGGGVSDMTLFYWFQKEHPNLLGDYPAIFSDSPFDVSMEEVRGFKADREGFKVLEWKWGQPNATKVDGSLVPLASLHFQGRGKKLLAATAKRLGVPGYWGGLGKPLELGFRILRKLEGKRGRV